MECFIIFVMAWCRFNATESKPQNVGSNFAPKKKHLRKFGKYIVYNVSRLKNVAKKQHQAFTNIHKTLN